jgi:hypothetical protein
MWEREVKNKESGNGHTVDSILSGRDSLSRRGKREKAKGMRRRGIAMEQSYAAE